MGGHRTTHAGVKQSSRVRRAMERADGGGVDVPPTRVAFTACCRMHVPVGSCEWNSKRYICASLWTGPFTRTPRFGNYFL